MNDFSSLILYIVFFSLACFFMYLSQSIKKNKNYSYIFFLTLSFLIPLIISGLRYDVGTDYFNYIRGYDIASNMSFGDFAELKNTEWGFFFIRKIAAYFNDYRLMFWIAAFLTLIFVYLAIAKNEDKISIVLSLMIYLFIFFPSSLNIVRQHIALAMVLYSYRYIFERKFIKYLLFCSIASSFHVTALIAIPFYFVFSGENVISKFDGKIKTLLRIVIIISSVIFVLNFSLFFENLSQIEVFDKFEMYSRENNTGMNREILLKGLILIIVLFFRKSLIKYDKRNQLYIFFLIIDIIITFVGFSNPFVKRVGLYFGITEILVLPYIVKVMNDKVNQYLVKYGICIYSIIYFILAYYLLKQSHVIPYNYYI